MARYAPGVESAHGMITLEATVHDGGVSLLRDALLGNLGIDPIGISPHLRANLAELDRGRGIVLNDLLESGIEIAIVQEDVRVVVPSVEVALDGLDGLNHTVQLLVPGEDDEGAVDARLARIGFETARDKDTVVLFADLSVSPSHVSRAKGGWGDEWEGKAGESWEGSFGCLAHVPNRGGRTGRHQYPAGRAGVADEEHQDQDDHDAGKQDDDAQGDGDARVAL